MKGIIIEKPGMWMIRDQNTPRPEWLAEIERAIQQAKTGHQRTAWDKRFRRLWHINKWHMRQRQGPTITRD